MYEKKTSPVFRSAMRGYNREDVNSYIKSASDSFEAAKSELENALTESNTKSREYSERISIAERELAEARLKNSEKDSLIASLQQQLSDVREECQTAAQENAQLREKLAESEKADKAENGVAHSGVSDSERAKMYDSLCAKAGEILVVASGTAEDILEKARREASQIVGSAYEKKENMVRSLTHTAESAASNISEYIKTAVDDCIRSISSSVNEDAEDADNYVPNKKDGETPYRLL